MGNQWEATREGRELLAAIICVWNTGRKEKKGIRSKFPVLRELSKYSKCSVETLKECPSSSWRSFYFPETF